MLVHLQSNLKQAFVSIQSMYCHRSSEPTKAFDKVQREKSEKGIVPNENSTHVVTIS